MKLFLTIISLSIAVTTYAQSDYISWYDSLGIKIPIIDNTQLSNSLAKGETRAVIVHGRIFQYSDDSLLKSIVYVDHKKVILVESGKFTDDTLLTGHSFHFDAKGRIRTIEYWVEGKLKETKGKLIMSLFNIKVDSIFFAPRVVKDRIVVDNKMSTDLSIIIKDKNGEIVFKQGGLVKGMTILEFENMPHDFYFIEAYAEKQLVTRSKFIVK